MKVVVAIPCLDYVPTPFALSLGALMGTKQRDKALRKDIAVTLLHQQGSILMDSRNSLVQRAIDVMGTHIFFLDSDMTFPPDTIERLASHHVPFVGTRYVKRYPPHELLGEPSTGVVRSKPGLQEMDLIPLGVSLTRLDVFHTIPKPWFAYHTTADASISEDYTFCHKARAAGVTLWNDTLLSPLLGHTGIKTFTQRDTL